jgi:hypothetical protein
VAVFVFGRVRNKEQGASAASTVTSDRLGLIESHGLDGAQISTMRAPPRECRLRSLKTDHQNKISKIGEPNSLTIGDNRLASMVLEVRSIEEKQ